MTTSSPPKPSRKGIKNEPTEWIPHRQFPYLGPVRVVKQIQKALKQQTSREGMGPLL